MISKGSTPHSEIIPPYSQSGYCSIDLFPLTNQGIPYGQTGKAAEIPVG
jgi:hypothetical protein